MQEKIILVGGGGHCRSVIDVIEQTQKFEIVGIVDIKENIGQKVLGYSIIGCDDDLIALFEHCQKAVVTVGQIKSNTLRVKLYNTLKEIGFELPVIISPFAYVSKHTNIAEGTVVMHQALINANSKIGKNCIINTKALIEHDATIGDHCHISTASVINGGVVVKSNSFYGSNTTSKEYAELSGFINAGGVAR